MDILITGGDGLLGRELSGRLCQMHSVHSLVHRPVTNPLTGVQYLEVDLSRRLDVSVLPKSIDTVIHLAQSSEFRNFPSGARDTFDVNTGSTLDLLNYCHAANGRKFILASTGGIYEGQDAPLTEAGLLIPPSRIGFYFASKLAAEMLASTYRPLFEVTVLRFFFMFGPRQRQDMFLPRLIKRVLSGEAIQITNDQGIRVNPICVGDAALLVERLVTAPSPPVLNVAGPDIVSIREIGEAIGALAGTEVRYEAGAEAHDIVADISTMLDYLPVTDLTPFTVSLREMVEHFSSERWR